MDIEEFIHKFRGLGYKVREPNASGYITISNNMENIHLSEWVIIRSDYGTLKTLVERQFNTIRRAN